MEKPTLTYITQLSGGDLVFQEKMIDVLKKEFPEDVLVFLENYKNRDYIEVANNIHKLKHKIGMLGLKKGYQLATEFEIEIKTGQTKLYPSFMKIVEEISLYLNNKQLFKR